MEIVIENPMESPPPVTTPPTTPLQPLTTTPWNAIVTAPSTLPSTTTSCCSSSIPTTTTMMTITIAENPVAAPIYPPQSARYSYRAAYANSLPYCSPYAVARRIHQPRERAYDDPDGAPSMSMRRVGKSGLLGITESEPLCHRNGLRPSRLLSGVSTGPGMVSPRRLECVGQLDPVPEVPGQVTRANVVASSAANAYPGSNNDVIRIDTCEPGTLARPVKSASFDSLESRHALHSFNRDLDGVEYPNLSEVSGYASSFRLQESCDARIRTLGRLARLAQATADGNNGGYTETCCNFPFAERSMAAQFPGFEEIPSGLPTTRATATTATTSTTTVAVSTMKEAREEGNDTGGEDASKEKESHQPVEVRAEAEGCEHRGENPLKDAVTAKRGDEFVDNDGIQTLRVIILSEEL